MTMQDTIFGKFKGTGKKWKDDYRQFTKVDIKTKPKELTRNIYNKATKRYDKKEIQMIKPEFKANKTAELLRRWINEKKTATGKTPEEWMQVAKENIILGNDMRAKAEARYREKGYIDDETKIMMTKGIEFSKNSDYAKAMAIQEANKEEEKMKKEIRFNDWKSKDIRTDGIGFL